MQTENFSLASALPPSLLPALGNDRETHSALAKIPRLSRECPSNPFAAACFKEIEVTVEDGALWCMMQPTGRPSFTPQLLADLSSMQHIIQHGIDWKSSRPFEFLVFGSRTPGVFNLGGDLVLFQEKILAGDRDGLQRYAHRCVEVVFANYSGYGKRVTTIGLIEGDALGGGLEAALSCDFIIAERHVKLGFPEILFNLFPGMGAYSFLSRRIGVTKTEEMLRSGRTYTAVELHELGLVDLVAEPGEGALAVKEMIRSTRPRHNAYAALYQVRKQVTPLQLQELKDITDTWVDAALRLKEEDLRRMSRITAAQDRAKMRISAA